MSTVVAAERGRGVSLAVIFLEFLPAALAVVLLASVGIVHVTGRVLVVQVGYELSRLDAQSSTLAREQERLKLELATLKSPARLETAAKAKLGMGPASGAAIVHLKASGKKR